jgi:hypothetical protein
MYGMDSDVNELIARLEHRGYSVGKAGISPEGDLIVAVNGKMLTIAEIRRLVSPEE